MTDPVIVGIAAHFHDSACGLLVGGRLVAAAQEERFTRVKHVEHLISRRVVGDGLLLTSHTNAAILLYATHRSAAWPRRRETSFRAPWT